MADVMLLGVGYAMAFLLVLLGLFFTALWFGEYLDEHLTDWREPSNDTVFMAIAIACFIGAIVSAVLERRHIRKTRPPRN